jgi:hypothetical protein
MLGFRPIKTNICLNIFPRNNYFLEDNPVNDGEIEIIDKVQDILLEILQYAFSSSDIRYSSCRRLGGAVVCCCPM